VNVPAHDQSAQATGADGALVRLEGVHKWFGNLHVLKGVDLTMQQRDVVVVIGPSGGGKSTLLRCVSLLEVPTLGRVWFEGKDITDVRTDLNEVRTHIGIVFQAYNLFPHMTAERNVTVALERVLKVSSDEAHDRAMDQLARVGMGHKAHAYPGQLSGGQQQRVAIARALVTQPTILLADEPTGNLDTRTSIEVMDIFQRLNMERGITVVLITHEMDIAEHGTRIVKFRDGRIQVDQQITERRMAGEELKSLPPPEDDSSHLPASVVQAQQQQQPPAAH